jgi:hypothetical protein
MAHRAFCAMTGRAMFKSNRIAGTKTPSDRNQWFVVPRLVPAIASLFGAAFKAWMSVTGDDKRAQLAIQSNLTKR